MTQGKDECLSLLWHLTLFDLCMAQTVNQYTALLPPLNPSHFLFHPEPPRFHNDGHMLDIFQRLTAKEGVYFLPQDMELSNQELCYIVKKAEQWRGFNGERRKVSNALHLKPLVTN